MPAAPRRVDALDQELCLMGATRMSDFIEFVRERAIGGRDMDRGDLAEARQENALWLLAEGLLPQTDIEAYTQGLMDLGASLCSRRKPACDACPLRSLCVAHAQGRPEFYPVKTRKLKRGQRAHVLLWLDWGDRVWLVQRPQTGVWAGLWSLPELGDEAALWAMAAGWPGEGRLLPPLVHVLTHLDWTLQPCHWPLPVDLDPAQRHAIEAVLPTGRWVQRSDALAMGLPAPIRRWLEAGPPA